LPAEIFFTEANHANLCRTHDTQKAMPPGRGTATNQAPGHNEGDVWRIPAQAERGEAMSTPPTGIASIRLRPSMTHGERKAVGEVFIRDFGTMAGPRLFIAGVPLDLAHKLVDVGLIESKTHGNLNDEQ